MQADPLYQFDLQLALPVQSRSTQHEEAHLTFSLDEALYDKLLHFSAHSQFNLFDLLAGTFTGLCHLYTEQSELSGKLNHVAFSLKLTPPISLLTIMEQLNPYFQQITHDQRNTNCLFIVPTLCLNCENKNKQMTFKILYHAHYHSVLFIEQFAQAFVTFLKSALSQPKQTIDDIDLLNEENYFKIVHAWNEMTAPIQTPQSLIALFQHQVQKNPDHIALIQNQYKMSYQELDKRSNQIAHHFIQQYAVKKGDIVAVCCDRSIETMVTILAIFKAGAIYLPIDPNYPLKRIAFILQDALPALVIAHQQVIASLQSISKTQAFIAIETLFAIQTMDNHLPTIEIKLDDLSYLIYTSGTTGQPKGVLNHYRGLLNRLTWMMNTYHFDQADTFLQKTALCFDISVWEILVPLLSGSKLAIAEPGSHNDTRSLLKQIVQYQVTVIHFVPSMLKAFLDFYDAATTSTALKLFSATGEALSYQTVCLFKEKFHQSKLLNLYGPTEASIEVTYWDCSQTNYQGLIPIGYSLPNVKLYILDDKLKAVPVGKSGELYIGGIAVARGYLHRPELNESRFIVNPFTNDGTKLYKTGDICRWLGERCVDYVGRQDQQIKLKGHRIELGEIEYHLMTHPHINYAVAYLQQSNERQILWVFIVADHVQLDDLALRQYLQERVPTYMLPHQFCFVDHIPTTYQGKVDFAALLAQTEQTIVIIKPSDLPKANDSCQTALRTIWSEVLSVPIEKINDQANFFTLGGDSLTALRILAAIEQQFSCEISIASLLEHPTLGEFETWLNEHLNQQVKKIPIKTQPIVTNSETLYPVSETQKNLLKAKNNHFVVPFSWRGQLERPAFINAVKQLVARHTLLQANFIMQNETWHYILNENKTYLAFHDFHHMDETSFNLEIIAQQQHLPEQTLDLATGTLFFIKLLCLNINRYVLIFYFNHLTVDRTAIQLILNDLFYLYENEHAQEPGKKALPTAFPYADFVTNEIAMLKSETYQQQLNYWLAQLTHQQRAILTTIPYKQISKTAAFYQNKFSSTANEAIIALCNHYQKTPFCVLITVFSRVLAVFLKQQAFAIGFTISKRANLRYENTVGPIINFCTLQCEPDKTKQLKEALQHNEALILNAYQHCDIPSNDVLNALHAVEDHSRLSQLFNVLFDFDPIPFDMHHIDKVELRKLPIIHSQQMQRYLTVRVNKNRQEYEIEIRFRSALFTTEAIANLVDCYQAALLDEYDYCQKNEDLYQQAI